MEFSLNDDNNKALFTAAMTELLSTNKEILHNAILEVIEDIGLANAIVADKSNELVSEAEIFAILDGNSK
jgi:hypothetical protein